MALDSEIETALAGHSSALADVWKLIRRVQRDASLDEDKREEALSQLFACLSLKDVRQTFVMDAIRHDMGVSFRSCMAGMMRLKTRIRKNGYNFAPGSNDKNRDLDFGSKLGIPTPRTLQHDVRTKEVRVVENTVIKPTEGANSRGVFFVDSSHALHSVRSRNEYSDLSSALEEAPSLSAASRWTVEQAIVGPDGRLARDLKVFMFYGLPGAFLEIDRSPDVSGKNRYAGYDRSGVRRDFSPNHQSMKGLGVPPDVVDKARAISLNTPMPFLRADFLVGSDECILGEITPHPGNTYAGDIYEGIDKELGDMFLDAEARLYVDLYLGKRFDLYDECYTPGEMAL